MNCGEEREIAALGLCFTCYRQGQRKTQRGEDIFADKHNPGLRREHKKLFRGFAGLMAALTDLGVYRGDVLIIRAMLTPYLEPIAKYLEQRTEPVNGEQESKTAFTVHTMDEKEQPKQ
jgi:hypothetical protein